MWLDGSCNCVNLPPTASIEEILPLVLKGTGFPTEHRQPWSCKILEIRKVHIQQSEPYIAVLLDTNHGRQIVLVQYIKGVGWWNKLVGAG